MSQPKSILIVDDDPSVLFMLSASLEKLSDLYSVDTCGNAKEALEKFRQRQYTLMITDYQMPGMNGLDLAQAVQAISPQTHILMLTAHGSDDLREQVDQLNLAGIVSKPSTIKEIREIVDRTISRDEAASSTVLVIEDNTDLRRLYSRALTRGGYQVQSTETFEEARKLIDQHRFDVLLCDIHIGRDRGTDLIREKQAWLQDNKTQIIMITGETWYNDIVEEAGADFLLEKPVDVVDLVRLVNRLTAVATA